MSFYPISFADPYCCRRRVTWAMVTRVTKYTQRVKIPLNRNLSTAATSHKIVSWNKFICCHNSVWHRSKIKHQEQHQIYLWVTYNLTSTVFKFAGLTGIRPIWSMISEYCFLFEGKLQKVSKGVVSPRIRGVFQLTQDAIWCEVNASVMNEIELLFCLSSVNINSIGVLYLTSGSEW